MSVYIYRLSQWIEKKFNAKGGNVITDFEQSARAVLPLPIGVEERYLQGWNRFGFVASQAAVAAQFSRARLRNPVGSNVIAVLEMLSCFTVTTDTPQAQWGNVTVDLTTIVATSFSRMDPRGNPTPTCIMSTQTQAALGTANLDRAATQGNVDFIMSVNQEIPILPGNGVDITSGSVNVPLTASFMWRERALELSELT